MEKWHLAAGQSWFDFIPLILALFVVPLLSLRRGRQIAKSPDAVLVPRYLETLIRGWLMVAIVAWIWLGTGRPLSALGLDMPISRLGFYGLLFCVAMVVLICIQHLLFGRLMKPERLAKMRSRISNLKILPRTANEFFFFLLVAITAGVWEELIYRGFLFWLLTPYVGVIGTIAISTLVFALGHAYQGFRGVGITGVVGLVFGIAFALTHSLWWLMAVHAIIDVNGGLAGFRAMRLPAVPATL
jgi:membrane protease YdiL (CAAX protease family)